MKNLQINTNRYFDISMGSMGSDGQKLQFNFDMDNSFSCIQCFSKAEQAVLLVGLTSAICGCFGDQTCEFLFM